MSNNLVPASVTQNVSGDNNVVIAGDENTINQTIIQKISNFIIGDTKAQRAHRDRRAMLELVRNTWIKGVLEKSLYHEVLIELGMEERPGEVDHPWDTQVQMPNQTNRTLPLGTSIINIFDEMNGAMLILGEPGSGKTTTLLELARDSITRAEQDPTQSIPVLFNLSSWNEAKKSIDDWLVYELNTKYNAPYKLAQNWVRNNDLFLLLDGLDEVRPVNREACVNAINDFRKKHGLTMPIAVCCRISEYETLPFHLNLQGAVLIQPLTTQQIDDYFVQGGSELVGIHQALQNDDMLQELVKKPLMLSILTLAYKGTTEDIFARDKLGTLESRRRQLFDTYIQQMFERVARTKSKLYSTEQTKHWLAWLARKMIEHNSVPFLIGNMQINWLSQNKHWRYRLINSLFGGLIGGLFGALIGGLIEGLIGSNYGYSLPNGMATGLFYGLIVGLIGGIFLKPSKIEMVDTLIWDWKKGIRGLLSGLIIGLIGGLIFGLYYLLFSGLNYVLFYRWAVALGVSLDLGLAFALMLGSILGLIFGLSARPLSQTTYPEQRISLSIRNFFFISLSFELVFALIFGLLWLLGRTSNGLIDTLISGLYLGLVAGLGVGLKYGGGAVIKHFALRFIISFNNILPWRLVRFLDYASERIFLRKVGGGYIFVHRLLMEHFAGMYAEADNIG
jgi:hypothetical protein